MPNNICLGGGIQDALTWDNLIYIADFLQASGERHISLLGGEPLLHHDFADFVNYLSIRGFIVTVFTSGITSETRLEEYAGKLICGGVGTRDGIHFVCNVNDPALSPKAEIARVKHFFEVFGKYCSLSFNIYRTDFSMDFLIDYIVDYDLRKHVRLGLAHPIPGAKNLYIPPEEFTAVRDTMMEIFPKMFEHNIVPGFDCGFPMCIFSDDDLGKLFKFTVGQMSFKCGPAIDIGTDLSLWSCFPLSAYNKRSLLDFDNYGEVCAFYEKKLNEFRNGKKGIFDKCQSCQMIEPCLCSGGCVAHLLNREEGAKHE